MPQATSTVEKRPAWRFAGPDAEHRPSLSEVNATIRAPQGGLWLRHVLAFAGPDYMASVGYGPGKLGNGPPDDSNQAGLLYWP